ncbi:MAG: FAD:protein FMN transferase [Planctomycetota bacterium]
MTRRLTGTAAFFLPLLLALCLDEWVSADDSKLLTLRGRTMGTTYMVKIFEPPGDQEFAERTAASIELELRRVNDQMSTYLQSSEISRFNASKSTDWFSVSEEVAEVVEFAQEVSRQTHGAFDVTVGPLVNRWSFGSEARRHDVPTDQELNELGESIGYQNLSVRANPPAIRKSRPSLQIDLSAIAKGHAVDRVLDRLQDPSRGEPVLRNVFVEIGGEVGVIGSKGPKAWNVGIQRPDVFANEVLVAHELRDAAMATSGDYRNTFEVDGVRYSHTIDPTTRRPVVHDVASVTVIADSCMAADAWATSFNVLGLAKSRPIVERLGMTVLVIERTEKGFQLTGTGDLKTIAESMSEQGSNATSMPGSSTAAATFARQMLPVAIMTLVGLSAILIAMAVGVIFGRKSISGSCGGLNAQTDPNGRSRCSLCSNPSDACKELREKVGKENPADVFA